MTIRAFVCLTTLMTAGLLGGCSSSLGGSGGSAPSRTYVVVPSGEAVPVSRPPGN